MENKLQELIELLKDRINVSDIISSYINIESKGNDFIALCPFHQDSNPSLHISNTKGIYKCFSCGAGGNIFNFVMNYLNVPFIESVKILSDKANIDYRDFINTKTIKVDEDKVRLYQLNSEITNYCNYSLLNTNNKDVLSFLKERDLNIELIKKFKLGLSIDNEVIEFLKLKGYSDEDILATGFSTPKGDKIFSKFQKRIIFPIFDNNDKTIGYTSRTYLDNNQPKYLNLSETKLFVKSNVLYGIYDDSFAYNVSKKVYLVEGPMDVIAMHKINKQNTLATFGVNFSDTQLSKLKNLTKKVILLYDNDQAGFNGILKLISKLKQFDLKVKMILLPKKHKDIDELIKNSNKTEIDKTLNTEFDPFDYFLTHILRTKSVENFDSKDIDLLLSIIAIEPDEIKQEILINKLSNKMNLNKDNLYSKLSNIKNLNKNSKASNRSATSKEKNEQKINELIKSKTKLYLLNRTDLLCLLTYATFEKKYYKLLIENNFDKKIDEIDMVEYLKVLKEYYISMDVFNYDVLNTFIQNSKFREFYKQSFLDRVNTKSFIVDNQINSRMLKLLKNCTKRKSELSFIQLQLDYFEGKLSSEKYYQLLEEIKKLLN